ncbi:hypothetical protein C2G38_2195671 [Gigaspora rosea]|uniref:Uncharacterized protein n=1 Tax=Gigaspora rosea TaxID=44941 RepID=A0A397UWX7_9GLOM|nr:hypothetical protein C2G38_2195671 [Gigaspora rosea]
MVAYRKKFLEEMKSLEHRIARYERETMEKIPPVLEANEKELILVTHDERNRRLIMVSEFLLEECSRLKLNEEEIRMHLNVPKEACCYLMPGKNQEGFWTIDNLLEQVRDKAIPTFEAKFPNAIAVFAFDNSTNHSVYAEDTFIATRMNLKPAGNQPIMRSTTFVGANGQLKTQHMAVLKERGLWKDKLPLEYKAYKGKEISNNLQVDCCARKIIASQPDFIAQKSAIVELIESAGHICIFYPKFHCELNFIEMYWGAAKNYARKHCDYTWAGLQTTIPQALDSVDTITIRKFAQKSWRYMELYREGLTGKMAKMTIANGWAVQWIKNSLTLALFNWLNSNLKLSDRKELAGSVLDNAINDINQLFLYPKYWFNKFNLDLESINFVSLETWFSYYYQAWTYYKPTKLLSKFESYKVEKLPFDNNIYEQFKDNILAYWYFCSTMYEELEFVATKIFSISVTSASVEHLFSSMGFLHTS